ncbi:hypothetical protein MCOR27_004845 [Pyricularia oryzae]|uniref:Uncharacterized protein n=2 Tax=Pyricularia oryzae TaxID=318829 RepID=G4NAV0_PYRO7|nr:uncharacterized protein MGG_17140 [Pyricularia oryzae 70-15]KAH8843719.1 hypothetical protein MCOR01_004508 [Pyricularia oryzae]EHA50542.1 hypothetical protein MGG_17140 [Pyricularia oryzae 70-15]KAH9431192.1 hypothetical protein MCOR02_008496 [Pyricularia oryzae]KAI6280016.1 hypothetical protein MCOR27_004845 [Pyricularia oryzae]KAI6307954.1 hypothetical protein MCOR34_007404 [Pyricularia oryzae]
MKEDETAPFFPVAHGTGGLLGPAPRISEALGRSGLKLIQIPALPRGNRHGPRRRAS